MIPALLTAAFASLLLAAVCGITRTTERAAAPLATLGSVLAGAAGIGLVAGSAAVTGSAGDVLGLAPLSFRYDGLSGVFLIAFGLSAGGASLSIAGERARSRAESAAFPLFLASIVLVFGASDAFSFLLAWESMALLSALLVVGLRPTRAIVSAGNLYLAETHVATAAILVSFGVFAAASGGQLSFAGWHETAAGSGFTGLTP